MKKLFYLSNLLTLCLIFCSVIARAQAPVITAGAMNDTACQGTTAMLMVTSSDAAAHYVWQVYNGTSWDTVHNDGTYSGAGNSSLMIVAATALSGNMYRAFAYNDSGVSASSDTAMLTVLPLPVSGSITGGTTVCVGATLALADTTVGGTWSSTNSSLATVSATGVVPGIAPGMDTIKYTVSNSCGSSVASHIINVNTVSAGIIAGPTAVCVGGMIMLTDTTSGGTWSSTDTSKATVSGSGMVMAVAAGMDTIKYTVVNSCGTAIAIYPISVDASGAGTITGADTICTGTTTVLSSSVAGGTWASVHSTLASISAAGMVTAIATGMDTINYVVTNSCGSFTATHPLYINTVTAGTITGASSVCTGVTITLGNTVTGGTWSTSDTTHATVSASGVVSGVAVGMDTVFYTVTNSCGTRTTSKVISVNNVTAGAIAGGTGVCLGSTTTLTDSVMGGMWSTNDTDVTVSSVGVVSGMSVGMAVITYSVSNACGVDTAFFTITVGTSTAGAITGASNVCVGDTIRLADTTAGGTWSSSNNSIATVSSTGLVRGMAVGLDTIMYHVATSCGFITVSTPITVYTIHIAGITGSNNVCVGSTITLADTSAGGTWSSSDTTIATVSATGDVSGIASGTAIISYTATRACGAVSATSAVIVGSVALGAISGPTHVCYNGSITLADTTRGGIWTSNDTMGARVDSMTGVVSGRRQGVVRIDYSKNTGCGVVTTSFAVDVDTLGGAPILGPSTTCVGSSITMTNAYTGGTWSVSNGNASISSTGHATGIAAGLDTVIYIYSNTCGTDTVTRTITIDTTLTAGTIAGPSNVCVGSWVRFIPTVSGGSWTSSNAFVATPDPSGFVTGRSAGSAIISYTFSNACGAFTATDSITVDRTASMITGMDSVGIGNTRGLSDSVAGGIWQSSDTSIVRVSNTGVITGVTAGTATITYTITNSCGTSWAAITIYVGAQPFAGGVTGPDTVCVGSTITLADSVAGGTWSGSNAAASVNAAGIVTGIVAGMLDTIMYTYTNGFGSTTVSKELYVNTTPTITVDTLPSYINLGILYDLHALPAGGVWHSSNDTNVNFVTTTGFVVLRKRNTTITYTVSNSCGPTTKSIFMHLGAAGVTNVNEANTIALEVYPNPNNGLFTVNMVSDNTENVEVTVTNMLGKTVKTFTAATNKPTVVDLQQPAGIYFINANSASGKYTTKVTIGE